MLRGDRLKKLAINIKYFRNQLHLTQKDLAEKLGNSRSVIAKWENENAVPDLESLLKLSKLFNVSLDHLVGFEYTKADVLLEVNKIYRTRKEMSREQFEVIDFILKNRQLQEALYKLSQLPTKERKVIEKILYVYVEELHKK